MAELDGRDIYLILDDDIFASENELSDSEEADMLETTDKHTPNKRKTFISGETTGTITVSGLYVVTPGSGKIGYHDIKTKFKAGTAVSYELGYMGAGGKIEAGDALVQSISRTANRNAVATYSITLQKTGDYTEGDYTS